MHGHGRNPISLFDLTGKVALVTGSSRGLGFTIARGLATAGATVVLNGRDETRLDAAVGRLGEAGIEVSASRFDVTDERAVETAVNRIEERVGPIEILVNNAGIQDRDPLETIEAYRFNRVLEVNLSAPFLVGRICARGMLERGHGKIINVCSLMSEVGRNTTGPYTASKGGLKMLTRAMAVEWAGRGVQVNGIGPGYFLTDMTQPLAADPEFDGWVKSRTPAGRWGKPEELVGTVIYLASHASGFVDGQVIYVDGGMLSAL